jgi:hypothetical protein
MNSEQACKEDRDYFKAITYFCTIFEYYVNQILLYHFRKDKILADKDRLERLTLETAIITLYTYTLISIFGSIGEEEKQEIAKQLIERGIYKNET